MFEQNCIGSDLKSEDNAAVYLHQRNFLLRCAAVRDPEEYLELFVMINAFYDSWGVNKIARVETSIKLTADGVDRNRYVIPVNPCFDLDLNRLNLVLEYVDAPLALANVIRSRHGRDIHVGVGLDWKTGLKKLYFPNSDRTISAYGFLSGGKFGEKTYCPVQKNQYLNVGRKLANILDSLELIRLLAGVIPMEDWFIVYDRFDGPAGGETEEGSGWGRHSGYHICPDRKRKIRDLREPLSLWVQATMPGLDTDSFHDWLKKTENAYLFWVGVGRDKQDRLELSLYIRNTDF